MKKILLALGGVIVLAAAGRVFWAYQQVMNTGRVGETNANRQLVNKLLVPALLERADVGHILYQKLNNAIGDHALGVVPRFITDANGNNTKQLFADNPNAEDAMFSADGKALFYMMQGEATTTVHSLDIELGKDVILTELPTQKSIVRFSASSQEDSVVYMTYDGELFSINVAGGIPKSLGVFNPELASLGFSQDGSEVFVYDRDANNLVGILLNTGKKRVISKFTTPTKWFPRMSVSPSGTQAYLEFEPSSSLRPLAHQETKSYSYIVNLTSGEARPVILNGLISFVTYGFDWSRDGKTIAISANGATSRDYTTTRIYFGSVTGDVLQQLPCPDKEDTGCMSPHFLPGGDIIYQRGSDIYRLNLSSLAEKAIVLFAKDRAVGGIIDVR